MSDKVKLISLLLIIVVGTVGIIWYVFRPGANETGQIVEYVISRPTQTDSGLESQIAPVDAAGERDVMNADELESLNRLIEMLEAMDESSNTGTESQETALEEKKIEERVIEESPKDSPSVGEGDMELAEQHFRTAWQEKLDLGNELLPVYRRLKENMDEILSRPVDSVDEVNEVRDEIHKLEIELGQVTVFFEDEEIIAIMNQLYGGFPEEVQGFLNRVEELDAELYTR